MRQIRFIPLCVASFVVVACPVAAVADPLVIPGVGPNGAPASTLAAAPAPGRYGGGFLEMLITGGRPSGAPVAARPAAVAYAPARQQLAYNVPGGAAEPQALGRAIDPRFERQEVAFSGSERPGTIVIDTPHKFLFLVEPGGKAMRYGIGVGREGFAWSGVQTITRKAEWPGWTPPADMILRRPDLPRHMNGGPANPLGARAMYLGSSLYRIHGTNEPETIGTSVSSGCIRLMNPDVIDLYDRVRVGTKVVVL